MEGPTGPAPEPQPEVPHVLITAIKEDGDDMLVVSGYVDGVPVQSFLKRSTVMGRTKATRREWVARQLRGVAPEADDANPLAELLGREDV